MTTLLTVSDVSKLLRVTPQYIYMLVRENRLPCVRVGRRVRFAEEPLMDWVRRGGAAATKTEPAA